MRDRPGVIGVESVQEHEDGSATYQLHMDGYAQAMLIEEGIKFILHCAAANMDIQDVYDWILRQGENPEPHEKPDTIWVDINDEGAVVAGGKGPAKYEGETTYVKASSLPEGRHPLSDDWFREKTAAFSYDDIRPMTDEERQRATEKGKANGYK